MHSLLTKSESKSKKQKVISNEIIRKKAVLYDIVLPNTTKREVNERLQETESLLNTLGCIALLKVMQRRHHAGTTSFIGRGKLLEIIDTCCSIGANLIIVNNSLKSSQVYAIEALIEDRQLKIEVWDRVDLILKIFSSHAKTSAAKLQLELANIYHKGPRIYGMGTELSQQGAGIGTRGRGETNTEIMKRHLNEHKKRIHAKIKKLAKTKEFNKKRRHKKNFKTISIIGYTNVGKSALFKALTKKEVAVHDALFVTLDVTTSKLFLPNANIEVMLSDTIGFIQNLPLELIAAFKSTLKEATEADLLLHVIDVGDPQAHKKIKVVEKTIDDITLGKMPVLYVYNKIDKETNKWPYLNCKPIGISARRKINLDKLVSRIEDFFTESQTKVHRT